LYSKFYSDSKLHLEDTTTTRDRTRLLRNWLSGYILDGKIKITKSMRGTTCGTVTESKLLRENQVLGVRSECRFQYKSS